MTLTPAEVVLLMALVAGVMGILATRIKLGCPECPHCQRIKLEKEAEQRRLQEELEKTWRLGDKDDDRRI